MNLLDQHCIEGATALDAAAINQLLAQVPDWAVADGRLRRDFAFRNYHQTIDFVNALAAMIHGQDHHPELTVTYQHCIVNYNTHSAGGALSHNDFICAAKADAIYAKWSTDEAHA
ncbi:MAG: 4a-hydroxytetrahydrobiopterin dehydratase [Massilia sp.]|jgi:4a-hydroxytetrahydrobiopterin dehydratase|nr:4a-hydroxytetrahydrobiopterin dehydratase [Massilia sp.]MDB5949920.1 4a-hydroxytetrahydrobiopterin dehydratase [Massilia sp.]